MTSGRARRVPVRVMPPEEATGCFDETNLGYSPEEAAEEAARATGIDLTSASDACPFGVDVDRLRAAVAGKDFDAALGVVLEAHPWPGILGRACRRPCERHDLGEGTEPLNVSGLERAAAEHGDRSTWTFRPGPPTGRRVAIVGAGSASSAAAYRLRELGHDVDVYEQLPVSGGMMFAGFPNFRLPVRTVWAENDLEEWGVRLHRGVWVDRERLEELRRGYDAVLLGTGKFKAARAGLPGEELAGVWDALELLTQVKLGKVPELGERVVVIGAGYTAQDAARTSRRLGSDVTIVYRRRKEEMPVAPFLVDRYVKRLAAEGIAYRFETGVSRIIGADGQATAVECVRTRPGPPGPDGRSEVVPVEGSEFVLTCDAVLEATGEVADTSFLPDDVEVVDGHIVVEPGTWQTTAPGLFAAGEMTGIGGTMEAFVTGLAAGDSIDAYLGRRGGLVAPPVNAGGTDLPSRHGRSWGMERR